jgi:adenylate cyclase
MVRIKQAEDESRRLFKDLELSLIQQKKAFEELKTTKMRLAETEAAAKLTAVFEKFVPKEFIKRIAPDGLEHLKFGQADTDFISILFCDIRSFTTLSEKMTPQELMDFLNDFFKRMTGPISQNKGFVDKFIGDAVMALFSIPEKANAGDALNSVRAAIGMQAQIASFNKDNKRTDDNLLRVGVGIHSGPVIIGTVGSEERMESTVTGDTVNLASRLEGLTKFYKSKILISQSTYEFVKDDESLEFRELDLVQVKGKEEPVTIVEVCNSDPEPIREQKLASREKFAEALNSFRAQKWSAATTKFKACLKICPEDSAVALYLERCKIFKKTPPPKDWKGEQIFDQK